MEARRAQVAMLHDVADAVRDLLTSEQRRKLPAFVTNMLDPRYLALIRDGTGMYVGTGGGGGASMFFGGAEMMMVEGAAMSGAVTVVRAIGGGL